LHAFKLYTGKDGASHVSEGAVKFDDRTGVVGAPDPFVPLA
jgi:hypothetical protein